ncbi:MAG: sulfatase-like hydrolase/transferase, partial [Bacteroidota bacterium]
PPTVPIPRTEENWQQLDRVSYAVSNQNYAANFEDFLDENTEGKPFCFWYGAFEPHRSYRKGAGIEIGLKMSELEIPDFLPDVPEVRQDFLDYMYEIMWFDAHLDRMIDMLEKRGMLENTIIIVTADNGMPFPRAKANLYEYGILMPLAISWANKIPKGREVDDLISFADFAPTILELTGVKIPKTTYPMVGKSFARILFSEQQGIIEPKRNAVYASREQHGHARYNDAGYPQRSIRTHDYLYIRNYKPKRWPAGAPHVINENGELELELRGFYDIDDYHMDYSWLNRENPSVKPYYELAVAKRPYEELYSIKNGDKDCLNNLVNNSEYNQALDSLRIQLDEYLRSTNDPRTTENGDILESYRKRNSINYPKTDN